MFKYFYLIMVPWKSPQLVLSFEIFWNIYFPLSSFWNIVISYVLLEYFQLFHPFGIFFSFPLFWNIFIFSILLECIHIYHPFGIYSSFPSFWNILVFFILSEHLEHCFSFYAYSQREGLCAQKASTSQTYKLSFGGDWSQIQWLGIFTYNFYICFYKNIFQFRLCLVINFINIASIFLIIPHSYPIEHFISFIFIFYFYLI